MLDFWPSLYLSVHIIHDHDPPVRFPVSWTLLAEVMFTLSDITDQTLGNKVLPSEARSKVLGWKL